MKTNSIVSIGLLVIIVGATFGAISSQPASALPPNLQDFSPLSITNCSDGVWSVSWSPDGTKIAAGQRDKQTVIFNATDGSIIRSLQGYTDHVFSVDWSPNGDLIATASWDAHLKIWNASTGVLIYNISTIGGRAVDWSPNGTLVAAGAGPITVFNVDTGGIITNLSVGIESLAWSPDGSFLASGGNWQQPFIKIWDSTTWTEVKNITGHNGEVSSIDWSSDGKMILTSEGYAYPNPTVKEIHLWDYSTGTLIGTITTDLNIDSFFSARFSPDDSMIVASGDHIISFWNTSSREMLTNISNQNYSFHGVEWSPDGSKIATGCMYDHAVIVWGDKTPPTISNTGCKGDNSGEINALNLTVDTGLDINFTTNEITEYEIIVDTDGIEEFNTSTDSKFTGNVSEGSHTVFWDMTYKNGTNVSQGKYPIQISLTDTSDNLATFNDSSFFIIVYRDLDSDSYNDTVDTFPENPTEWMDSDNDSVGDNGDAFPLDPNETADTDNDSIGDNSDAFPTNPTEWVDTDNDSVGDNTDVYPTDPEKWKEFDMFPIILIIVIGAIVIISLSLVLLRSRRIKK